MTKTEWAGLESIYIWPRPIMLDTPVNAPEGRLEARFETRGFGSATILIPNLRKNSVISTLDPAQSRNPEEETLKVQMSQPVALLEIEGAPGKNHLSSPVMYGDMGGVELADIQSAPGALILKFEAETGNSSKKNRIVLRFSNIPPTASSAFLVLLRRNLIKAGLKERTKVSPDSAVFELFSAADEDALLVVLDQMDSRQIDITLDELGLDTGLKLSAVWPLLNMAKIRLVCDAARTPELKIHDWAIGSDWLGWETKKRWGFVPLSTLGQRTQLIRFRVGVDTEGDSKNVVLSLTSNKTPDWELSKTEADQKSRNILKTSSEGDGKLPDKIDLSSNQAFTISGIIEFSLDPPPKPRLSICIDLGASSVAAAFGFSNSAPVPIYLGERQEKIDLNHAEIGDSRLLSSAVALHHDAALLVGWSKSPDGLGYDPVGVPTASGPPLFLQFPHPSNRNKSLCSFRTNDEATYRDGLVIIPPVGNPPDPIWACEGYKQAICNPARHEETPNILSHPGFSQTHVMTSDIFEAALIGLVTTHIAPRMAEELENWRDQEGLDLSQTQLILTYPSGLPQSIQSKHYRKAGKKALAELLGPAFSIRSDQSVKLISEARATAYQAAHNPIYLSSPVEGTTYPGRGRNFLIVADIGKSTADFCIATFSASGGDERNLAADFETFQTVHEFGTTLGGKTFDEALQTRLESLFAPGDRKWAGDDHWRDHQSETVAQSKALWSGPDAEKDPKFGAVELDLAWSQSMELASGLVEELDRWIKPDALAQACGAPDWSALAERIDQYAREVFASGSVEKIIFTQPSGDAQTEPDYEIALTNCAANGELLLTATGRQRQWRLVLRGYYKWLMASPPGRRSQDLKNQPWPLDIVRLLRSICEELAGSIPQTREDPRIAGVNGPVDHLWLLMTGRTTLYRAFRYDDFKPERTIGRAELRRLKVKSTKEGSSAQALKSIVVDGALALVQRGIYHSDRPSVLSLGQVNLDNLDEVPSRPWPMQPLERIHSRQTCLGDLVTGPPFTVQNPWELTEFPDLFRGLFRRIRSIDYLEYAWTDDAGADGGEWTFYQKQTDPNMPDHVVFRLTPDGEIHD